MFAHEKYLNDYYTDTYSTEIFCFTLKQVKIDFQE